MQQVIEFSKMHGLGNDFMVVDTINQSGFFSPELICRLSDRHRGVGFDQLLLVEKSYNPNIDFHYRIFNADGSEVFQCGNGARCFAHFVRLKNLTNKRDIKVSTQSSKLSLSVLENENICVNMGIPKFISNKIFFKANRTKKAFIKKNLQQIMSYGLVFIGNFHYVLQIKDINTSKIISLIKLLNMHKQFYKQMNIGFMQIIDCEHILLRVYERGVGETQACGSGACAAAVVGIYQGLLRKKVFVDLPGGKLKICWDGLGHPVFMTGPSTHVYDGVAYF